jgi:stage IV sporulation protein FB
MKSITFRLLGFPVTIHPIAWLVLGFLVLSDAARGPQAFVGGLIWALVLFVSILVHELGHAVVARHFGLGPVQIELLGFLGFARYQRRATHGRAMLVTAAGPGAGMILGLLSLGLLIGLSVSGLAEGAAPMNPLGLTLSLLEYLALINIVFSIFNLLPMRPLDGGNLLDSGLMWLGMAPGRVDRVVAVVSIVFAVLCGLAAMKVSWFLLLVAFWVISRNLPSLGFGGFGGGGRRG